jgi:hypothetical protein
LPRNRLDPAEQAVRQPSMALAAGPGRCDPVGEAGLHHVAAISRASLPARRPPGFLALAAGGAGAGRLRANPPPAALAVGQAGLVLQVLNLFSPKP